mmetsp:Transcript_7417/g.13135  ORF Transcript_7417/g.13135 Transcript_7417/m.13135 type:complete len:336 (-) Transcript_7417:384-1391(-)
MRIAMAANAKALVLGLVMLVASCAAFNVATTSSTFPQQFRTSVVSMSALEARPPKFSFKKFVGPATTKKIKALPLVNQIINTMEIQRKEKEARFSFRSELEDLYRMLGVEPDTPYPEVKAAAERLKKRKYAEDRKMSIKVDNALDRVFELQLAERLKNIQTMDERGMIAEKVIDREIEAAKKPPLQAFIDRSAFLRTKFWLPETWRERLKYNAMFFFVPLVMVILLPSFDKFASTGTFAMCAYFIAMNGQRRMTTEEIQATQQSMGGGMKELVAPFSLALLWFLIGDKIFARPLNYLAIASGIQDPGTEYVGCAVRYTVLWIGSVFSRAYPDGYL